jgi:shikimate kinase
MARILWLNGTFGVGKTTTAKLVAAEHGDLRFYDPEWVGYLLRDHLRDRQVTDFQQLPGWRRLVPLVADELVASTGQDLIAVQTVLVEGYWRELAAGLAELGHEVCHVVLEATEAAMHERIASDEVEPTAAGWRLEHIPRFAAARPWLGASADLVLDTTELTVAEAAKQVLAAFDAGSSLA